MDIKSLEFWTQNIEDTSHEQVMMNTSECVIRKLEKGNCKGCSYELNCAKLSSIIIIQNHLMAYKPNDFLDSVKTRLTASDIIESILNAKTPEEIEKIIRGETE